MPERDGRTVVVSNLPEGINKNKLKMHFQKRKNCGGAIETVTYEPGAID